MKKPHKTERTLSIHCVDAASRFVVGTEDELVALLPLRYLDRDLCIVAAAFHLIYGASGSGKTFYAIERAMRLAEHGLRVLYIIPTRPDRWLDAQFGA